MMGSSTDNPDNPDESNKLDKPVEEIERSAERMRRSRESPPLSPMRGLGTFGMIGWSIVVPTVGGIFLGIWLDKVAPQVFSWTIALLFAGVILGGVIAWRWVMQERAPD